MNMFLLPCRLLLIVVSVCSGTLMADESGAVLVFAGDIMLAEKMGAKMQQGLDPLVHVADILKKADAAIGNLECVVATKGTPLEGKPFTFEAPPMVMPVLAKHFGIVSLANNHTGDFGHEAFLEQLDLLDQNHIAYFGGGRNCVEARTPHVVVVKGLRIAFLGYNEYHPREFEAGPSWPGVAWSEDEQVLADIRAARTIHHADLVIPFMHWGHEHEEADRRQKKLARLMIDNGADAVVGSHPHITQAIEYYKGRLIAYSLGNFATYYGIRVEGNRGIAPILTARLDAEGRFRGGHIDSTVQLRPDGPSIDPEGRALLLMRSLTAEAFPDGALVLEDDGNVTAR